MTADPTAELTEALADVLMEHAAMTFHRSKGWVCSCGEVIGHGVFSQRRHPEHVAAALVPVLAQQIEDERERWKQVEAICMAWGDDNDDGYDRILRIARAEGGDGHE